MRKKGNTNENETKLIFSSDVYSITAIKRVLSNYTNQFFVKIEEEKNQITVLLESKNNDGNTKQVVKEMYNKILEEDIRYGIECETKSIRNLMYEKAMNIANNECE